MLSMKQAASRPRPPLPSAASGSAARSRSRSTPRSPSAARNDLGQAEIAQHIGEQPADQEFQRQIIDALARPCAWLARSAASQRWMMRSRMRERGRHEPVRSVPAVASLPTARASFARSNALFLFRQDTGLVRRQSCSRTRLFRFDSANRLAGFGSLARFQRLDRSIHASPPPVGLRQVTAEDVEWARAAARRRRARGLRCGHGLRLPVSAAAALLPKKPSDRRPARGG